jgi:hypothetical protein
MRMGIRKILVVGAAASVLAAGGVALAAPHGSAEDSSKFQWLIGTGGVSPPTGPEISRDPTTGDILELVGKGTFTKGAEGSITGGGTFVHTSVSGTLLAHGTWTATGLDSFQEFGNAAPFPENFEGGIAILDVTFHPADSSTALQAELEIDCAINSPSAHPEEGVKVSVPEGPHFTVEIFGETLFIHQD